MALANQWQYVDPYGLDVNVGLRTGVATPEAQYPDGYLTPMKWRRGRGAADVAPPLNARDSYERGVNKHTKLPPEDYMWAEDFSPTSRLSEPYQPGPNRMSYLRRQGYGGSLPDQITARGAEVHPWFGQELNPYVNKPPWSP